MNKRKKVFAFLPISVYISTHYRDGFRWLRHVWLDDDGKYYVYEQLPANRPVYSRMVNGQQYMDDNGVPLRNGRVVILNADLMETRHYTLDSDGLCEDHWFELDECFVDVYSSNNKLQFRANV